MKKMMIGVIAMVLFSGCAGTFKSNVEQAIRDNDLHNKATTVCYDLIDKKECPVGTLQLDVNILPFIPMTSRICAGVSDTNATFPDGMYCYRRNIIK